MEFKSRLGFDRGRDHALKQNLERHGMCAAMVSYKEFAITMIDAVVKCDGVVIVVTMKRNIELVEPKAGLVLSIPFCFLQFADQSVIHVLDSPFKR